MQIQDFTSSDSKFSIKLPRLYSCDTFSPLPRKLFSRTNASLSMLKNIFVLLQKSNKLTALLSTNLLFIPLF